MHSLFPLIVTDRIEPAVAFYRALFGLEVVADLGWYAQLQQPGDAAVQIAFIASDHDSVPEAHRRTPQGVLVTIEVDDAADCRARVADAGHPVQVEIRDEPWGQRHFMVEDPTGLLVDVVQQLSTP